MNIFDEFQFNLNHHYSHRLLQLCFDPLFKLTNKEQETPSTNIQQYHRVLFMSFAMQHHLILTNFGVVIET